MSIRQNPPPPALPDFCNLGVILRTLLAVNALGIAVQAWHASTAEVAMERFAEASVSLQPLLLLTLLVLCGLGRRLAAMSYWRGVTAVLVLVACITLLLHALLTRLMPGFVLAPLDRQLPAALGLTAVLLYYFELRSRALSPAFSEARLQALQARIRPHFLFNSLNAVLSLIRSDPKRAERALEDMADLFRVLMRDNRRLSTLRDEVALCRQYLDIEQLRLGERLRVEWHVDKMPERAAIPPLVLQPLVENAVYHGIEPSEEPGLVSINVYRSRDEVHAVLRNTYREQGPHHAGNRMALENIRERLALHFDMEASLATQAGNGVYQVHIIMPYVEAGHE